MSNSTSGRPKAVTLIGRVCIVLGIVILFNTTIVWAASFMVTAMEPGGTGLGPYGISSGFPPGLAIVFDHFNVFAGLQVLFATALIYFAAMLLRLKSWARSSLEGMGWASLAALVVFWAYWLHAMLGGAASSSQSQTPRAYASTGIPVVITSFFALGVAFGAIVLLKGLRRKEVKEACRR